MGAFERAASQTLIGNIYVAPTYPRRYIKGKSRSIVVTLLGMTPKDTAPGSATEKHVAAPSGTRAFGTCAGKKRKRMPG